jgi:disulfide bond formation protein DsbB
LFGLQSSVFWLILFNNSQKGYVMPHFFNRSFNNNAPSILALLAVFSLVSAYVAQYGFGLAPCKLCLWQRVPFMVVAVLGLVAWLKPAWRGYVLGLMALAFGAGLAIAAFHVGVEQKWWQMPGECGGVPFKTGMSAADFAAVIKAAKVVRCDQPAFTLFGMSMAGFNVLWSGGLALLAALFAKQTLLQKA